MKSTMTRYHIKCLLNSAAIVALSALLGGCFSLNPRSLRQMESALKESNPDIEFESTMKFGMGALTMDLVDLAFVPDNEFDLSKVGRTDVGIYEMKHAVDYEDFTMPQVGGRDCPQREVIIRVHEDDSHTEIAVCIRNEKITAFSIFTLDEKELVIVNCHGDFEAMVSSMVRGSVSRKES
jgi:hypothetical protein